MSLIENVVLTIIGGIAISEAENDFEVWKFFSLVIGIHLLGILMKCLYYSYQHPWMSLSASYKSIKRIVNVVMIILVICIIIAMPLSVHIFELNKKYSTVLYVLFGLSLIMVSAFMVKYKQLFRIPSLSVLPLSVQNLASISAILLQNVPDKIAWCVLKAKICIWSIYHLEHP